MKNILIIIIFFLTVSVQHFFFNNTSLKKTEISFPADSVLIASICFVGDLMCHSTQFNYAKVGVDTFDFTGVYQEVKQYLSDADLAVGNLETVIAGKYKGYSGYPYFNSPDDFIYALKEAGFDVLVTANNHALDQGWDGVKKTIDVIEENKLHQTGTFLSQRDRDSIRVFEINNIKIAILAYSENTNGLPIPKGKEFAINLIDEELIKNDIIKAREENADIIIVHLHYGTEYFREPSDYQKEIVKKIVSFGADIIIGGHPHVIQPFDYFKTINANVDTGLIAYSMGNFISNQRWRYSDAGVILNFQISKKIINDSVYISNVNYIPTWVFRGQTGKGREYIILPSQIFKQDSNYNYLTSNDWILLKEAFEDTKEIVTKYNSSIQLQTIYKE